MYNHSALREYEEYLADEEILSYDDFREWFKLFGGAFAVAGLVSLHVALLRHFAF